MASQDRPHAPDPGWVDPRPFSARHPREVTPCELGGVPGQYYESGSPEFCPGCGQEADWIVDQEAWIAAGEERLICASCGNYLHRMEGAAAFNAQYALDAYPVPERSPLTSPPPEGTGELVLPPVWYHPRETRFQFYLGVPKPRWVLQRGPKAKLDPVPIPVPGFPSYIQLRKIVKLRPAAVRWALDSGGFTILKKEGRWSVEPERYAADVRRYMHEIGGMDFASIQDWMCEPAIIHGGRVEPGPDGVAVGTHLSVEEHQRRTVLSYLRLKELAPEVPWIPILQGYKIEDYYRCIALYMEHGVSLLELQAAPRVGIGSVCRRQSTRQVAHMLREFRDGYGLTNLHGFGFKIQGLLYAARFLRSADSQAWSKEARLWANKGNPNLLGHYHGEQGLYGSCKNCPEYAVRWRNRLIDKILVAYQRVSNRQVEIALRYADQLSFEELDSLLITRRDRVEFGENLELF